MSRLPSLGLAACLFCAGAASSLGFALAQAAQAPVPNFSSVDLPWMNGGAGFLPPPAGPGPITTDKAHPVMARNPNNRGEVVEAPLRLADLSNPNLKPWVVDRLKQANEELLARGLRTASRANCMPPGVPQFLIFAGGFEPIYFIQTPKEVVMIHQANTEVRHVYLNVAHSAHPAPSWYGESVGRYEGDELVVDTIGFNDVNYRHVPSAQLLTEEPCAENNSEHLSNFFHSPTAAKPDF